MENFSRESAANTENVAVTNRFQNALELARSEVYKEYLSTLENFPPVPMDNFLKGETPRRCLRALELKQLTRRQGEDINQKLSTVYHAAMSLGCSLFVVVNAPHADAPANFYLGVRAPDSLDRNRADTIKGQGNALVTSFDALEDGLKSHFPGSQTEGVSPSKRLPGLLDMIFSARSDSNEGFLSAVSCVASIRDKQKTERKEFIQGLEKLVDTMRGRTYTAVVIAEPLSEERQRENRGRYETLYTALSLLHKNVLSFQQSESEGITNTLTDSITYSVTYSDTHTDSSSKTHTKSTGTSLNINAHGGLHIGFPPFLGLSFGIGGGVTRTHSQSHSSTEGSSDTKGKAKSASGSTGLSSGITNTRGASETVQMEWTDKHIGEMLARIDEQLRRLRESEDYGAYSCGAYFLSNQPDTCLLGANTYRALMTGEGAAVERGAVNVWSDETTVAGIKEYLRRFAHPLFDVPAVQGEEPLRVTPGTTVSGLELPLHLGLPTHSVIGLPVIEHAEFGRNVMSGDSVSVSLGKLYHMGREESGVIRLDRKSLASHTFVTGSTGAGKTNTVCTLLRRVCLEPMEEDAVSRASRPTFLVVEPAKGEYKNFLGNRPDVYVYGTNPKKTPLLRLNPFSFPEDTHVLEHIDRLVEIFNACWPMYAAMPAVLKDAIESAYRDCGWNLSHSERIPSGRFPCFADLLKALPEVMRSSDYSADTKNDYTGALVTRVKSLTNGINGQIFCLQGELSDAELFDRNVIADLSRVGSMETKSLLMGILTMKLLEYRMAQSRGDEEGLRHITVLEEAHNLLRRTPAEQPQESSNLQGKSVEMLSNSIAEMRSYGEGFIIADQAPALLDMAVIRNTNTKIIHRLPDESDRVLAGKAAGLNDGQITEIYRLEQGVAAVFQNHWQEPVLCKVEKFPDTWKGVYNWKPKITPDFYENDALFRRVLHGVRDGEELSAEQADRIRSWIDGLHASSMEKELLRRAMERGDLSENEREKLAYYLLDCKTRLTQMANRQPESKDRLRLCLVAQDTLQISGELAEKMAHLAVLYASKQDGQSEAADWYRPLLDMEGGRLGGMR